LPSPADPRLSVDRAIQMIWRQRWRFLLVFAAVASLGAVFLVLAPLKYTSHALVMVASRQPDLSAPDAVVRVLERSDPDVDGEIQLIESPAALKQVVKDLHLAQRPAFEGAAHSGSGTLTVVRNKLGTWLGGLLGRKAPLERASGVSGDPTDAIVDQLRKDLKVEQVKKSTIVEIAATARDPALSTDIANAVARTYTVSRYNQRVQDAERAANWLKQRSAELREKLVAIDGRVEQFRAKNGQVEGRDLEILHKEIETIDGQLTAAKAAEALAKTKLAATKALVRQVGPVAALDSSTVGSSSSRLREEASQLHSRLATALAATGPEHPTVVQLRNEARKTDSELAGLMQSKLDALASDAAVAARQTRDLEQMLQRVRAKYDQMSLADVTLRSLKREANAADAEYESFLNRFRLTQQVGFDETKGRIVSTATVPRLPSSPNVLLVFVATLVCALGAAASAVMFAEYRSHRGVLSTEQMAPRGLRALAMIPEFDRRTGIRYGVVGMISQLPNSPFTESIAALHMSLALLTRENSPHGMVLMFGSSLPFEGKSTTAAALAALIASTGRRVLLVDADLRAPSLHRMFGSNSRPGLANCLDAGTDLDALIRLEPVSGVSLLAAGIGNSRPQEVLHSARLREAVQRWRDVFDFVLIDTPPVLTLSDARIVAPLADHCVFVVRWGKTSWNTAAHGINLLGETGARVAGVALSRVDLRQLGTYDFADSEAYRGSHHRRYISDGGKAAAI
jgi:capsular exopolysaccharide synthesis family protein